MGYSRPQKRWRIFGSAEPKRSSARSADERARVVPKFGFLALRAVEPSLEPHPFGATASSRTRVFAAHHRQRNSSGSRQGSGSAPCGMTLNSRPVGRTSNITRKGLADETTSVVSCSDQTVCVYCVARAAIALGHGGRKCLSRNRTTVLEGFSHFGPSRKPDCNRQRESLSLRN